MDVDIAVPQIQRRKRPPVKYYHLTSPVRSHQLAALPMVTAAEVAHTAAALGCLPLMKWVDPPTNRPRWPIMVSAGIFALRGLRRR